jgi:hypothetical protein
MTSREISRAISIDGVTQISFGIGALNGGAVADRQAVGRQAAMVDSSKVSTSARST